MTERKIILRFLVKREEKIIKASAMWLTTYDSNDDVKWLIQRTYGSNLPALLGFLKLETPEVHQLDRNQPVIDTQIIFDEPPFQIVAEILDQPEVPEPPKNVFRAVRLVVKEEGKIIKVSERMLAVEAGLGFGGLIQKYMSQLLSFPSRNPEPADHKLRVEETLVVFEEPPRQVVAELLMRGEPR